MDDLINMVAGNESPTDIHSKIKDLLTKKASDNVDVVTPAVTASMFGGPNPYLDEPPTETDEVSPEAEAEVDADQQPTDEVETDSSEEEEIERPTAEVETPDDEEEN